MVAAPFLLLQSDTPRSAPIQHTDCGKLTAKGHHTCKETGIQIPLGDFNFGTLTASPGLPMSAPTANKVSIPLVLRHPKLSR